MTTPSDDLVSVVIPAFNAQATIAETLESIQRQVHSALEVVVVDNGSTDGTAAIVQEVASRDPRFRLVSSPRLRVGGARNLAFTHTRGAFVAPIDADDIWHPDKIALQLQAMRAGGPRVGFVYTFYRRIDMQGGVIYDGGTSGCHGRVYLRQLLGNFVGTGSSPLVRREAWLEVGGYPEGERTEGCEDYLFQVLISRNWEVGVVPAYLTGYRLTPGSLSTRRDPMRRAHFAVLESVRRTFPETPARVLALAEIPNRFGQLYRAAFALDAGSVRRELGTIVRVVRTCSVSDLAWLARFLPGRLVSKLDVTARQIWLRVSRRGIAIDPKARVDFYQCDTKTPMRPLFSPRWRFLKPVVTDDLLAGAPASRGAASDEAASPGSVFPVKSDLWRRNAAGTDSGVHDAPKKPKPAKVGIGRP